MEWPEITVIGTGGLGQTFIKALHEKQLPLKSIFNRTASEVKKLATDFHIGIADTFPESKTDLGSLTFLTVSDRAIQEVAIRLSELSDDFSGYTFVHCSGNMPAEHLQALRAKGAQVVAMHPLQSFTTESGTESFNGIYFTLEGDQQAFPELHNLALKLGASVLEVDADQKSYLHAAAVMASNYLNTLLQAAVETAEVSGLSSEEVKKALFPLIKRSLKNIEHTSFEEALTGPIKRGDVATVQHHLELLEEHDQLCKLYCMLGRRTISIALQSGNLKEASAKELKKLLNAHE